MLLNSHPILTSVPDSPHEPDPEPYEPMPPRLIPLDEVSTFKTCVLIFISVLRKTIFERVCVFVVGSGFGYSV